jgi:hypothetical protein
MDRAAERPAEAAEEHAEHDELRRAERAAVPGRDG